MPDKDCLMCRFLHTVQMMDQSNKPIIGEKVTTCRRFPPTAVLVPGPNGSTGSASAFPPVGKGIRCAEYSESNPDAISADHVPLQLLNS